MRKETKKKKIIEARLQDCDTPKPSRPLLWEPSPSMDALQPSLVCSRDMAFCLVYRLLVPLDSATLRGGGARVAARVICTARVVRAGGTAIAAAAVIPAVITAIVTGRVIRGGYAVGGSRGVGGCGSRRAARIIRGGRGSDRGPIQILRVRSLIGLQRGHWRASNRVRRLTVRPDVDPGGARVVDVVTWDSDHLARRRGGGPAAGDDHLCAGRVELGGVCGVEGEELLADDVVAALQTCRDSYSPCEIVFDQERRSPDASVGVTRHQAELVNLEPNRARPVKVRAAVSAVGHPGGDGSQMIVGPSVPGERHVRTGRDRRGLVRSPLRVLSARVAGHARVGEIEDGSVVRNATRNFRVRAGVVIRKG